MRKVKKESPKYLVRHVSFMEGNFHPKETWYLQRSNYNVTIVSACIDVTKETFADKNADVLFKNSIRVKRHLLTSSTQYTCKWNFNLHASYPSERNVTCGGRKLTSHLHESYLACCEWSLKIINQNTSS